MVPFFYAKLIFSSFSWIICFIAVFALQGVFADQPFNATGVGGNLNVGKYIYGKGGLSNEFLLVTRKKDGRCYMENQWIKLYDSNDEGNQPDKQNIISLNNVYSFPCNEINDIGYLNGAYSYINDIYFFSTKVARFLWPSPLKEPIKILLNHDLNRVGRWRDGRIEYGDGYLLGSDIILFPASSLDIIAHEMGHAYVILNSVLSYEYEFFTQRALQEYLADLIMLWVNGKLTNSIKWTVGESLLTDLGVNLVGGNSLRYFRTPSNDGYSIDHMSKFPDSIKHPQSLAGVMRRFLYIITQRLVVEYGITEKQAIDRIFELHIQSIKYWKKDESFSSAAHKLYCESLNRYYLIDSSLISESFSQVGILADGPCVAFSLEDLIDRARELTEAQLGELKDMLLSKLPDFLSPEELKRYKACIESVTGDPDTFIDTCLDKKMIEDVLRKLVPIPSVVPLPTASFASQTVPVVNIWTVTGILLVLMSLL